MFKKKFTQDIHDILADDLEMLESLEPGAILRPEIPDRAPLPIDEPEAAVAAPEPEALAEQSAEPVPAPEPDIAPPLTRATDATEPQAALPLIDEDAVDQPDLFSSPLQPTTDLVAEAPILAPAHIPEPLPAPEPLPPVAAPPTIPPSGPPPNRATISTSVQAEPPAFVPAPRSTQVPPEAAEAVPDLPPFAPAPAAPPAAKPEDVAATVEAPHRPTVSDAPAPEPTPEPEPAPEPQPAPEPIDAAPVDVPPVAPAEESAMESRSEIEENIAESPPTARRTRRRVAAKEPKETAAGRRFADAVTLLEIAPPEDGGVRERTLQGDRSLSPPSPRQARRAGWNHPVARWATYILVVIALTLVFVVVLIDVFRLS